MKVNENLPYQNLTYFKKLNSLRFFAAFLVLLHHGESMKLKHSLPYLGSISLFHNGTHAVTFFFVLSGFLITFFLLKEKKKDSGVRVRHFYVKRALRIFPLYFLLVLIGTLIIPFFITHLGIDYEIPYTLEQVWYYYVLFFPCLVTFYYGHHLLEPLWSIGVEVLFYSLWAPLFKVIKKNILLLLLSVIAIKIILLSIPFFIAMPKLYSVLVNAYSFEAMAVGGLGAYFVFNSTKAISSLLFFQKTFQYFVMAILIVFLAFNRNIDNTIWRWIFGMPVLSAFLMQLIFLYIIIAVSLYRHEDIIKENKALWYLGEISYGIYMYHTIVISVVIILLKKISFPINSVSFNLIFYVLVIGGTILISHLSKKYFENYFLKLGKRMQSLF